MFISGWMTLLYSVDQFFFFHLNHDYPRYLLWLPLFLLLWFRKPSQKNPCPSCRALALEHDSLIDFSRLRSEQRWMLNSIESESTNLLMLQAITGHTERPAASFGWLFHNHRALWARFQPPFQENTGNGVVSGHTSSARAEGGLGTTTHDEYQHCYLFEEQRWKKRLQQLLWHIPRSVLCKNVLLSLCWKGIQILVVMVYQESYWGFWAEKLTVNIVFS